MSYDLCVIGGGPAGVAGAIRATDLGKRVALVDAGPLGGAGIFDGALSSKAMWHLSGDFVRACRVDRGWEGGSGLSLSWPALQAEVKAACHEAQALIERQLASLERAGKLERFIGRGTFVEKNVVEVAPASESARRGTPRDERANTMVHGPQRVEAERFLLTVGSKPRVPGMFPVDGERVLTSDHVEHLETLPARLAIIGAGVVGCEYATVFAHLGKTKVELFDRQSRILPFEDEDVSAVVASQFAQMGVDVHREASIASVKRVGNEVVVSWTDGQKAPHERRYDAVLVATGRAPSVGNLGLELAGVTVDKAGGVVVTNERTSASHVWAAGDVTPDLMLANLAELEARRAVEDMYGLTPPPIVHEAQSSMYFLSPEVGTVGLNEEMAKAKGIRYRAGIVSNAINRRNIAMRSTTGFVKLLATPEGKLLGLRVVGPQAGTCIQGVALLIGQGGTIEQIEHCVHPHPAVTEGVLEAARLLLGRSIYKPDALPEMVRIVEG
ncbi:MAG TPA: NAD(P)/FAD-dependent oxidoreductase [Kofleriaceae bacterium]